MAPKPSYDDLVKRVEELEKYEAIASKYQTLFDSFPHGITVSDANGNIIETNAAAEKLLGVNKKEHEQRTLDGQEWRLIRPNGSDMPPEEWASVIALKEQRIVANCEMGIKKSRDNITWINVTAAPLPSEKHGVVVTYSDITEKKNIEKSLSESEQRFRHFFNNASAYCYMISPDGIILEANATTFEKMGYSENDLIGRPLSTLYADESLDSAKQYFAEWKKAGRIRNAELIIKTKNGDKRWVLLDADAVTDESGQIIHSTSIQIDITERKKTEESLFRNQMMLNRTENITNVGSWEWEVATDTVMWSEGLYNIFQLEPSEKAPSWSEHSKLYHPDDIKLLTAAVERALLVWRLLEYSMRRYAKENDKDLPGWKKRRTKYPTTFMLMTRFQYLMILKIGTHRQLNNPLSDIQKEYLGALGLSSKIFTNPLEL